MLKHLLKASLLLLCSNMAHAQRPLQLCYESFDETPNLPQLQIGNERIAGFHAAVVAHALQQQQLPYQLHRLPWRRCLAEASRGQMDGAIGVGWTAERAENFYFPLQQQQPDTEKRLTFVNYYIYALTDSALNWDGAKITGTHYGLAAPKGYVAEHKLKQLGVLQPLDSSIGSGLALVLNNRLDGYVLPGSVAEAQLTEHPQAHKIRKIEPAFLRQDLFLAISKRSSKLDEPSREQLWQQIAVSRVTLFANPPLAEEK